MNCVHRTWRPVSDLPFLQIPQAMPCIVIALTRTSPVLAWRLGRPCPFLLLSFAKH